MKTLLATCLKAVWVPAVRRAGAEFVLATAAAALAAAAAYFEGAKGLDPTTLLVARIAIAWAERVFFQAKAKVAAS